MRDLILSLNSALVRSHLKCWDQFWTPHYKRYMNILEAVQQRATKMTAASLLQEKAKRAGTVYPGKEKAQRDPIHVYKHQMGDCNEDIARLISVEPNDGTRGNGKKMKNRKFTLNFTFSLREQWHRLLREVVGSPLLEIFKRNLEMVMGNWLYVSLLEPRVGSDDFQRCFPHSGILWYCEKNSYRLFP